MEERRQDSECPPLPGRAALYRSDLTDRLTDGCVVVVPVFAQAMIYFCCCRSLGVGRVAFLYDTV